MLAPKTSCVEYLHSGYERTDAGEKYGAAVEGAAAAQKR